MNPGRGGNRFSGFSVGPRHKSNAGKSGSLHAVPPPPSMMTPGNANTVPVASRFSRPGSSTASYNRFPPPSAFNQTSGLQPSATVTVNKQGYSNVNTINPSAIGASYGLPTSRPKTEDE